MSSDRSLCSDCLCYIQEEEKILLDEEFNKNCPHEMIYAWGDGICDLNLNNKETDNTSLAAPGALASRLQRRTAHKASEANLDPQIKNPRSLLYSNMGALINFR